MTLADALLSVLSYWPDQLARKIAQDELSVAVAVAGGRHNKKMLGRLVMLLGVRPERAQHPDVWRARPIIKAAAAL